MGEGHRKQLKTFEEWAWKKLPKFPREGDPRFSAEENWCERDSCG